MKFLVKADVDHWVLKMRQQLSLSRLVLSKLIVIKYIYNIRKAEPKSAQAAQISKAASEYDVGVRNKLCLVK